MRWLRVCIGCVGAHARAAKSASARELVKVGAAAPARLQDRLARVDGHEEDAERGGGGRGGHRLGPRRQRL
eukprot:6182635-Pleurochrysis_carterae.AAC.1